MNFLRVTVSLIDLIVPPRKSERIVRTLTPSTLRATPRAERRTGGTCEVVLPYRDMHTTALVWELKYYRNPYALTLAAQILEEPVMSLASDTVGTPLLAAIPMHPQRLKERGHNQAETLCAALARRLPQDVVTYVPSLLERTRPTRPQQGLPRTKRVQNAAGSMRVREAAVARGRACIVIDDVATTGATFAEARRALEEAGVNAVYCVALSG